MALPTGFYAAETTIIDRWYSQWATLHPANVPTVFPNILADESDANAFDPEENFNPTTHKAWIRFEILEASTRMASIGGGAYNRWRTAGIQTCQIFVPQGVGTKPALEVADDIRTVFNGWTGDGVGMLATSIAKVGRTGRWYQVNAHTPFKFDVLD